MEIVVDAYDSEERAIGWYCYLENQITFPFTAVCIAKRSSSPLRLKEELEVLGMADDDDCYHEMFVIIRRGEDSLAVPLMQLRPSAKSDADTLEAIEDWHYWVARGYSF